jgi:hypothetical protein
MPMQWKTRKKIQGVDYDIYYYETNFYGGSKMIVSRMEKVNDKKLNQENTPNIRNYKGEISENSKR